VNAYRILDSNLNRLSEGLRVIEEYFRFIQEDVKITEELKKLRQTINSLFANFEEYNILLQNRNSDTDIGKSETFDKTNLKRLSYNDVLRANFKRTQEAARVMEEYSKLLNIDASSFKKIRFKLYSLEKKTLTEIRRENEHTN